MKMRDTDLAEQPSHADRREFEPWMCSQVR